MSNQSDDEFETGDSGGVTGGLAGLGGPVGLDGGQMAPGKVRAMLYEWLAECLHFR